MSAPLMAPGPPATPTVQANIAANLASLAFLMLAGVVAMPIWLRLMGAEAYGLVGFYALLSAGFQIFDAGLSQTFARECARFRGGALSGEGLRRLFGLFERIFLLVAVAGAIVVALAARPLALNWLRVERLDTGEVALAVMLMGVTVACQWVSGFYRGAVIGFERQTWLAILTIGFSILRYFGVIAALLFWNPTPSVFFGYQACVAAVELATQAAVCRVLLRSARGASGPQPAGELKRIVGFSAGIAFATACWAGLMQGDKLVLSKLLTLSDYGVFTLAATAIGAAAGLGAPIAQAILPRLTKLTAEGDAAAAIDLYRSSTQLACLIAFPPALLLGVFGEQVIWVWTGDAGLIPQAAPILQAYALGAASITVAAFAYYLQYAHGSLRLHVIGQALHVAALAPPLVFAATHYGAVGAGLAWTAVNVVYFFVWTPLVHRRFAPGLHWRWLWQDIAPIAALTTAVAVLAALVVRWPSDRIGMALWLAGAAGCVFGAGVLASSVARHWLIALLTPRQGPPLA